ncbi:hypothetical protein [Flavobacterium sp.]|uniref:hypothetical protein n=1 Tax=Flavobacterium sp. TaxID=239 RepID=UPI0022BAD011|nr:hypothetical protein [Flavobacterium sp.]MCZ8230333.1 hypothetical protein [Flavobacterium sp.]
MIVGIRDLENHFFVGAIETKMPIINYDAVKKEIIHRIFAVKKAYIYRKLVFYD